MVKTIYKLDKFGNLTELSINKSKIQKYIDKIKDSLTVTFYNLESKCNRAQVSGTSYKQYFTRNVVELNENVFSKEDLGIIEDYEYFQDIYFDDKYMIHYRLTARINREWEFRYIIQESKEKLPTPIMQMVKMQVANFIEEGLKENYELDQQDVE